MAKKKYVYLLFIFLAVNYTCNNANSLAREGLRFYDEGKKITALKYFEEALESNRKNPIALYGKGKIMLESTITIGLGQKMIETAMEKLDEKYRTEASLVLAKSYAATNLYDKAIEILDKSVKESSVSPAVFQNLSFYYSQMLKPGKAVTALTQGIEKYPQNPALYLDLSSIYIRHFNNWTQAVSTLESFTQKNKPDKDILINLASLYYKMGKRNLAVEKLNQLKNLQSNEAEKKMTEQWIIQAETGNWETPRP